jgi:hypothetical protein
MTNSIVARAALLIAILGGLSGCVADDPACRDKVVALARDDTLESGHTARFDLFMLPGDLKGCSQGGMVNVERDGGLIVVFYDVRGTDHYTGWIYASTDTLREDPMGEEPFKANRIAPNWFRVDAG